MQIKYIHLYLPIFVVLWLGLYLDSVSFSKQFSSSQWLTNLLVLINFIWVYKNVTKQIQKLMLYGVVVAFGGEIVFSLLLGMYHYRLDNIPLYVPLGHAIIYASVYYISKEPWIQKHQTKLIVWLYAFMIFYSLTWLFLANDIFGFLCTLGIVAVFAHRPQSKLYFLLMFIMIVYLELLGTHYGCWIWPDIWFDTFTWIPSANPPSGISLFYFAFDAGCLWMYKQFNPHKWRRLKRIKSLS
jgi:hypothetical protein